MLEIKDLFAGYNGTDIILNINFMAETGKSLCVLGPNGCGKSTLLKAITGIIECSGNISLNGENLIKMPLKEKAKKITLLSQNAQVYFPYTVFETVSMGRYAYLRGFLKNLSEEDNVIIKEILEKLDLLEIKDKMIDELSGGMLQRVFLARSLVQTPDIILLDEPANHLDIKYQIELLDFLKDWVKKNNKILISVFHDLNMARQFGDTAIVMNNGIIAAHGEINKVLNSKILNNIYEIDIQNFMKESLKNWNIE